MKLHNYLTEPVARITKARRADGTVRRALYNWVVHDAHGELIAHGGPVSLQLARHNCLTLGARLGAYHVAEE